MKVITEIALGTAERISSWDVLGPNGEVKRLSSLKKPSFRDSLTAVKMRYELTGKAQAAASMGKQAWR